MINIEFTFVSVFITLETFQKNVFKFQVIDISSHIDVTRIKRLAQATYRCDEVA